MISLCSSRTFITGWYRCSSFFFSRFNSSSDRFTSLRGSKIISDRLLTSDMTPGAGLGFLLFARNRANLPMVPGNQAHRGFLWRSWLLLPTRISKSWSGWWPVDKRGVLMIDRARSAKRAVYSKHGVVLSVIRRIIWWRNGSSQYPWVEFFFPPKHVLLTWKLDF